MSAGVFRRAYSVARTAAGAWGGVAGAGATTAANNGTNGLNGLNGTIKLDSAGVLGRCCRGRTGSFGNARAFSTAGAAAAGAGAGAGVGAATAANSGLNAIKVDNAGRACRVGVQIGRGTGLLAG